MAQFAAPASINGQMNAGTVQSSGGSQPHDNMIPLPLCRLHHFPVRDLPVTDLIAKER